MDANFFTLFNLVADIFIGSSFIAEEIGKVGLGLTPEEVMDEEFYAGFNERLAAIAEQGRAALRKRMVTCDQMDHRQKEGGKSRRLRRR